MRTIVFMVLLGAPTLLGAQIGGLPPIGPPGVSPSFSIEDTEATVGSNFDVTVLVEGDEAFMFSGFTVSCDAQQIQLTGWDPGPSLQAHIDENGIPPSCDVYFDPTTFSGFFLLAVPFDTAVHGNEWVTLHYEVVATEPGETTLETTSFFTGGVSESIVTIVEDGPGEFVRGDFDGNGNCNLVDAVQLLQFLHSGGAAPACMDAADIDDSGSLNIGDPIMLLNGLFGNGTPLEENCEADPTSDALPCDDPSC